jgi:hypothetical protein
MIGNTNGFTLPHGGAAFAGTRRLLAGLTEEATKE